jgi:hypothetical protein
MSNWALRFPAGSKSGRRWKSTTSWKSSRRGVMVSRYIERICSVMLLNVALSRMWMTGGGTS